jgi:glutathione S-transferase
MELYIGNKNYSSWSLRAWLAMKQPGIAFTERALRFDFAEGSTFKKTVLALAPTARVPILVDEGFAVWDSLAIAEYLAERCPEKRLWPVDPRQRGRARSLCAEMHSGFFALRERCPMNVEASLPEVGPRLVAEWPDATAELRRIDAMWREALAESGGPFLFGAFGIVDAYFAPICVRAQTYQLPLGAEAKAYAARILALPAMQEWSTAARAEHAFVEEDEPYRQRP